MQKSLPYFFGYIIVMIGKINSMKKYLFVGYLVAALIFAQSCSRKTTPTKASEEELEAKKVTVVKPPPPIKTPVPKSIVVNDKAATKTVQGRYYYDLEGKRYWRNKNDGKYYLYFKGMFDKPEFQ
ncbi:MAG: hypothetical protein H7X88_07465 [Gloeobacteraceae cyanobacterium ES-bin-316]|nr:hypothetical protein [Ferruginibacter sp.]